ncbi:hypothetical protein ACFQ4H_34680, partial [Micromonospora sonneratiae]
MTSEGLQHPGQEPEGVAPGAAGPAPHGSHAPLDQQRFFSQQDAGSVANTGWAPPPPQGGPANPQAPWGVPGGSAAGTGPDPAPWGPPTSGPADAGPPPNLWAPPSGVPDNPPASPHTPAADAEFPAHWGSPPPAAAAPPPAAPPRW